MQLLAPFLVIALAQAPASQAKKALPPPPSQNTTPAPEERAKVRTEEAGLFESVEMLRRCRAAIEEEEEAKKALATRDELRKKLIPPKSRADMTDEEFETWKMETAEARKAFQEHEARYAWTQDGRRAGMFLAEREKKAKDICNDATTARLTEGTLLTVLKRDELVQVRVETGRATGKVGFVLPESIKPAP